jgi:hypothetical protein
MLKFKTYAENIRVAAKSGENAQNRPLTIRELSVITGFSYEHIRKIWHGKDRTGQFSLSGECNDILCAALGLPKEEMWQLAQREKVAKKLGYVPMQLIEDTEGRELSALWKMLDRDQHAMILQMARALVGQVVHAARG